MTISRLRGGRRAMRAYDRADVRGWKLVLLVALRCYALAAILIAIYAFVRALH